MLALPGVTVCDSYTFGSTYSIRPVQDPKWVKSPRTVYKSAVLVSKSKWKNNLQEIRCVADYLVSKELFKLHPSHNCMINLRARYGVDEDLIRDGRMATTSTMHRASATIVAASTARNFTDLRIHLFAFFAKMERGWLEDGTIYRHFRQPTCDLTFLHVTSEER